jgi:hypothetical protein
MLEILVAASANEWGLSVRGFFGRARACSGCGHNVKRHGSEAASKLGPYQCRHALALAAANRQPFCFRKMIEKYENEPDLSPLVRLPRWEV